MTFAITATGTNWPAPPADAFPDYLQFQQDGENVGDSAADTVNFVGDVSVTRGEGENAGVVTVAVASAGSATPTPPYDPAISWRDVPGDYTLVLADSMNGLVTTGSTGAQTITIPPNSAAAIPVGESVLVFQEGAASVNLAAGVGVTLYVRDELTAGIAGQFGICSLIKRATNSWILCGDLGTA